MGKRTVVGAFVHNRWAMINVRSGNGVYRHLQTEDKCRSYSGVEVRMTREEFKSWCWQRQHLIETLSRPSIDRIDKSGHYSLDNIQIIELDLNLRKDRTVFQEGYGICFRCKVHLPEDQFVKDKRRQNGRTNICRPCEVARKKD